MSRSFKHTPDAAYKLRVYYLDGGTASLFSRDWRGKSHDPEGGRIALQSYVTRKAALIRSALLYDKLNGDRLLFRFRDGAWMPPHAPASAKP